MSSDREFEFSLVLGGIAEINERVEDALFESGCDDATLSLRRGRVYLTFSRGAGTKREAILSAIRDVVSARIGAEVLRVDSSELVTQAEIAGKLGTSRQHVHQLVKGIRGPGGFPAPVCDLAENAPLWSWREVAQWLAENAMLGEEDRQDAADLAGVNSVLVLRHLQRQDPLLIEQVTQAIDSAS